MESGGWYCDSSTAIAFEYSPASRSSAVMVKSKS